jgi:hypothetical protein
MFRIVKYIAAAHIYRRSKKPIVAIGVLTAVLILSVLILNDFIREVEDGRYLLLFLKWGVVLMLLAAIAKNIQKVIKTVKTPPAKPARTAGFHTKKERILAKEHLLSRRERIIAHYKKGVTS